MADNFKFSIGDRVKKTGGSYQATGIIRACFKTRTGENRVVFDFDSNPGLLHIFNETQLEEMSTNDSNSI